MTTENLVRRNLRISAGCLRKFEKKLREKPFLQENRLFEKELLGLYQISGEYTLWFEKGSQEPFIGKEIASLGEINDENVIRLLTRIGADVYLGNDELSGLVSQCRYALITDALENANADNASDYIRRLYAINELDAEAITEATSPLHEIFMQDETYAASTVETQAYYRRRLAETEKATGLGEQRLAREIKNRTRSGIKGIGEEINADWERVFLKANVIVYIVTVLTVAKLVSLFLSFFTVWWVSFFAYLPCIAIVKPICDMIFSHFTRRDGYLPRLDFGGKVPASKKTICVLSTLVSSADSVKDGLFRLRQAKIRNDCDNIEFVLLCDLPASDSENAASDPEIGMSLKDAAESAGMKDAVIIIRRRTFSKTQRKWQGRERKRGAIDELVRFVCGENPDFLYTYGEMKKLRGAEYLVALDYDTVPLMDTIPELVSIASHPLNSHYGIFAPRISSSIDSTLSTVFSRRLGGVGGAGGISSYDSVSAEFYSDCFGEGIFTGKGLIRIKAFYEKTKGAFPEERVLSHDILEGGLLNVIYCGDIEFMDSFPPTSRAYFKRLHRWLRGDFQNIRFIFSKKLSHLTKFKLFDNVVRGIIPANLFLMFFAALFVRNDWILALTAVTAIVIPYLPSLIRAVSSSAGLARRFYSPIISEAGQLAGRAVLELIMLPYSAYVSVDAAIKTIVRLAVTKRELLQWTTSGIAEKTAFGKNISHIIPSFIAALILLVFSILRLNPTITVFAVIMTAELPILVYCDRKRENGMPQVPKKSYAELKEAAVRMYRFFTDYVDEENNFLPPDNVQFTPVYRVCRRTSPTNIGMYLLSVLCVCEMGIIDENELFDKVKATIETVTKMKKWNGNLYNWYETNTLTVVSGFVSTVDSGNFICCLVALKEGLKAHGAPDELTDTIKEIIDNTDLSPFFSKKKKLFSIGYDTDTDKLSPHHYDMLMSEARMTCYYAIASGQAPKAMWRSMGRTMSRTGRYAGPVAWTGTMFEFFMPELLLHSKEGSLSYEAIKYALYCQKRRCSPWGISESAYYAFDRDLNYQYKAHGVQKNGLKPGLDEERVVSPYSSFLTLAADPAESINNLVKLERDGARSAAYGYYEAIDYTGWRVGGKAVIKSHMAHHMGMSIVGIANAICNNIAGRYFMMDEKAERASELLEERVIAGERILAIESGKEIPAPRRNENEVMSDHDVSSPRINVLSNGMLSLFLSDGGICRGSFGGKQTVRPTRDILRRPHGEFYGFVSEGMIMPFAEHPLLPSPEKLRHTTVFSSDSTRYDLSVRGLELSMDVSVDSTKNVVIRHFTIRNKTNLRQELTLCAYIEPALAREQDLTAHPMFADMFVKVGYDSGDRLFTAVRKERHSDRITAMAVGFSADEDISYCLSREDALDPDKPFSFFRKALERTTEKKSVPSPCFFIKASTPVDAGKVRTVTMFMALAESDAEARELVLGFRAGKTGEERSAANPLVRTTLQGRAAIRMLPSILYGAETDERIIGARKNCNSDRRGLWRFGVSGDYPIIVFDAAAGLSELKSALLASHGMSLCGVRTDLIIMCENSLQKGLAEKVACETGVTAVILEKTSLEPDIYNLIFACAACVWDSLIGKQPGKQTEIKPFLPILPCKTGSGGLSEGFDGDRFVIKSSPRPWCNILASDTFGTLLSNRSLGFSWAHNSHEFKITPWFNDIMLDNTGEMLLLKRKGAFFDLINGAETIYTPDSADYHSKVRRLEITTGVRSENRKEITVTVENTGDKDEELELIFYIEPVLGVNPGDGFIKAEVYGNTVSLENPFNPDFKEKAVITVSREAHFVLDRNAFWKGDFSQRDNPDCRVCAAVVPLKLPPRDREKIRYILSCGEAQPAGEESFLKPKITIESPDERLNAMFNFWLPHQIIRGRMKGRTGFHQNGGAFGFRDQLQDSLAAMFYDPELCRRHILKCCSAQFSKGDVLHWWHEAGEMKKGVRTRYSDDMLWLPYTACEYAKTMSDKDIWNENVPYSTGDELSENEHEKYIEASASENADSVYNHCKAAMENGFSLGRNGLLKIGGGDWNDGYNNVGAKGHGESVWLSMFYIICAREMASVARERSDISYAEKLEERSSNLVSAIEEKAWDGAYYLRAFYDDGTKMGSAENDACRIDLLPQAFAVFAGLPDTRRVVTAINNASDELVDEKNGIIKLFSPAFSREKTKQRPGYVMSYPEGLRENGGQYTHAAVWLCIACFRLGQNKRAFELLRMLNPANKDERFGNEPYFMTADIYTNPDCVGRGGWSIYTGAAAWYWKCIFEGLFGIRVKDGKIEAEPAIPPEWSGTTMKIEIMGTTVAAEFICGEGENKAIELDGKEHNVKIYYR